VVLASFKHTALPFLRYTERRNIAALKHPFKAKILKSLFICRRPGAALFCSLIESAKLCGVEPRAYLREATLRAARNSGVATLARDFKSAEA
jgi:hypothetical protein